MEGIMLAIKYVLFYGMEVIVFAITGVVLISGLYTIARRWVRAIQRGPFPRHTSPLPFVSTKDLKR